MCLYPRLIENRKYRSNKKNGGIIPPILDQRVKYVPVGCGQCKECRKQKAREWQIRLLEDIKTNKNGKFVTLTFSNEKLREIIEMPATKKWPGLKHIKGYRLDNEIAKRAVHLFIERHRKLTGKSIRHWLVTELGHKGTENIHLHGILWTNLTFKQIEELWQYGHIWPREGDERKMNFVNGRTVNYIVKYVNKMDLKHKHYKSIILTSPGIGSNYTKTLNSRSNIFNGEKTNETYKTPTGHKISLPIYWRNKIYSDSEKEKLWIQRLDKNERWVCGEKVDISKGHKEYWELVRYHRQHNIQLGYMTGEKKWDEIGYENQLRHLKILERIKRK